MQPSRRIRVHFFGRQPERTVSALAGALGAGPAPAQSGTARGRFDRLVAVASHAFEVVTGDSAELWLYAHDLGSAAELDAALQRLPTSRPPCAFFYDADDVQPIPVAAPNVALFRTSLFASRRLAHEHAMPALCDDLLAERTGQPLVRPWNAIPSVGFCGFVGSPLKRLGFQVLGQHQKNDGLFLRERALRAIENGRAVRTQFVRRTSFWGGAMSRFHFNSHVQRDVRAEFVENLFATDYGLCVRGKGNFSYRFYEVLSAGRIPVLVNSDCVLPFEGQIDWKRHTVWLEESELESAAERVRSFHAALGAEGFERLQQENRELWKHWLSPEAFYRRAAELITGMIEAR